MAETLTSMVAPGFFSQVSESPNLFLSNPTLDIVGVMGTGAAVKAASETITRGASGAVDGLTGDISSVNAISSNAVYQYPLSSFGLSVIGSVALPAGGFTGMAGLTLTFSIAGATAQNHVVGFTGATASVANLVSDINGNTGLSDVLAVASGNYLALVSTDGQAIEIGAGTTFNAKVGFTEDQVAGGIYWTPGVTLANLAPQTGTEYVVDYNAPKVAADFGVKYVYSSKQAIALYGDLVLANSISMGANALFANGASIVACRQLDPSTYGATGTRHTEIESALSDLENTDVNVLVSMVPLNDDMTVVSDYLNHVSKMSSKLERKERIIILGTDERTAALNVIGANSWETIKNYFAVASSSGLTPKRVIVVSPGLANVTVNGTSLEADGTYVAAALAGRIVSAEFDAATPMTRKTLATIDSMDNPERTRAEKNILTGYGITVVEMKNGIATVRRAVTADATSMASQEPSVVRAFDKVIKELRELLEQKFVGTKIVPLVTTEIEATTNIQLLTQVNNQIIGAFRNVKAEQNALEPRQIDISMEAIPIWPLNWGMINLTISIS